MNELWKLDLDDVIAFENGELDEDQVVEMVQHLIDSGLIFELQGSYQRLAAELIKAGLCHA